MMWKKFVWLMLGVAVVLKKKSTVTEIYLNGSKYVRPQGLFRWLLPRRILIRVFRATNFSAAFTESDTSIRTRAAVVACQQKLAELDTRNADTKARSAFRDRAFKSQGLQLAISILEEHIPGISSSI